jgi:group II intron reverse transcriptase/maturase
VSAADGSGARAYLLHTAKDMNTSDLGASGGSDELLGRVASRQNLAVALLNVARNKGASGVDGCSVDEVVGAAPRVLPKLREALLDGSYRPGDIRRVWIPKPGGGERGLGIPNVIDRWVQQAVHQILAPIYEPSFHGSSHGFRPYRGAKTAIAEAMRHLGAGHRFVVDLDLSKFFDRVNHQRLLDRLRQRVKDRRLLLLIKRMLKAKVVLPDGTRVTTDEGTPQGGPLSPLLSNIVLDELDWELERRGLCFVRYADDCNIFARSERAGVRIMAATRRFIESRLRLQVNEEKSAVAVPDHRHFLGFSLRRCRDGQVEVHLSKRSRQRLDTRIRELTPAAWGQSLAACFAGVNQYLSGWSAYYQLCTPEGASIFARYDAHIRRRIRRIIIHQKRRPRYLYRHLLKRGVNSKAAAGTAYSRRGAWHRSNRPGMTRAYPNIWFVGKLTSLRGEWCRFHPPKQASGQAWLFDPETLTQRAGCVAHKSGSVRGAVG